MSGIAKPHITHVGALPAAAAKEVVLVEEIKSVEPQDIPAMGVGKPAEYRLLYSMKDGTFKSFKFADATKRNTTLTNALTALSTAVAQV